MATKSPLTIPTFTMGDRLRKAREHAGIGSQEMADHLLVSRNTITRYESDASRITDVKIRRWAEVTAVPVAWLLAGEETSGDLAIPGSPWIVTRSIGRDELLTAA